MSLHSSFTPHQSSVEAFPSDQAASRITKHPRKRPKLVWLISFLLVIGVIAMNGYFLAHLLGHGSDPVYAANLSKLTAIDFARRIVGATLSLAAGVSLFLLRKIAVQLFAAMVILDLAVVAYGISIGTAPLSALAVLLVPALITWYSLRLKKQGLLV